ncbi:bi-domain-containing oxidoreductase [bacterium]|nr:bi-domain-containing oxidoreductase [bacterium]
MKQVLQNFKSGKLELKDVPPPVLEPNKVFVQNINSLISAGTERMVMEFAQKSLAQKAKARPDLVKQIINKAKNEGIINTFRQAMGRLDTPMPLGYSCAGVVLKVGADVDGIHPNDRVASAGGGYANHAEIVCVPKNLCVKIPDGVKFESAAFTTLGAVALQGVRIANLTLGETVVVIGLGLLGQLTVQLVKAAGCRVFGIDLDAEKTALAVELGANSVAVRGKDNVVSAVSVFSQGFMADAVIITAASDSNDPVELAGEICRDRGRVSVVGAVKMDIPRKPYYEKELELRLSRSYGPGRYNTNYEEKGFDYPIGYVRWTEQRNMQEFLQLVAEGKIQLDRLITHRFKIDDAEKAYELIAGKTQEKYLGVLLEYPQEGQIQNTIWLKHESSSSPEAAGAQRKDGKVHIGLIGGGNFAKGVLLPILRKIPEVNRRSVATATGVSARDIGDKYGFEYCTSDYSEILNDTSVDAIIIATRHNLHAQLVIEGLKHGKSAFVEKPLALSKEELNTVIETYNQTQGRIMVGFNRRFAPFTKEAKGFFANRTSPLAINYRINAGFIPKDSWVHDPVEGGGRIIGEVCHFVDLIQYLVGVEPSKVYAEAISESDKSPATSDTVCIGLKFKDGSIGTINYFANGDKAFPKERIEIFGDNSVCVIDDFRSAMLIRNGKKKLLRSKQDKGHKAEVEQFIRSILNDEPSPIDFKEAVITTLTTFKILESFNTGAPVEIESVHKISATCFTK